MEVNKTGPDLSRDEILLEEPHFDEESTLLSARPVVPLEVVEAKSRSLRNLWIGSAIVVALLIGGFAATFVYKLRAEQQAGATARDDSSFESQPSLQAGISGMESQEPEPIVESQEPEAPALDKNQPDQRTAVKNVPATSPPLISREPSPRIGRTGIKPRKQDELIEEDLASQRELNQEIRRAERRDQRREERREERRARRVEEAKHQGSDRDSRATDDLLRIREIFEGRPKP